MKIQFRFRRIYRCFALVRAKTWRWIPSIEKNKGELFFGWLGFRGYVYW